MLLFQRNALGLWLGVGIAGFSALMTDCIRRLRSERQCAQSSRAVAVPAENPPGPPASLATVGPARQIWAAHGGSRAR